MNAVLVCIPSESTLYKREDSEWCKITLKKTTFGNVCELMQELFAHKELS